MRKMTIHYTIQGAIMQVSSFLSRALPALMLCGAIASADTKSASLKDAMVSSMNAVISVFSPESDMADPVCSGDDDDFTCKIEQINIDRGLDIKDVEYKVKASSRAVKTKFEGGVQIDCKNIELDEQTCRALPKKIEGEEVDEKQKDKDMAESKGEFNAKAPDGTEISIKYDIAYAHNSLKGKDIKQVVIDMMAFNQDMSEEELMQILQETRLHIKKLEIVLESKTLSDVFYKNASKYQPMSKKEYDAQTRRAAQDAKDNLAQMNGMLPSEMIETLTRFVNSAQNFAIDSKKHKRIGLEFQGNNEQGIQPALIMSNPLLLLAIISNGKLKVID